MWAVLWYTFYQKFLNTTEDRALERLDFIQIYIKKQKKTNK